MKPEQLSAESLPFWPPLSEWPTVETVDEFVRGTRTRPEARLGVLTGLRHFVEADVQPLMGWLGIWIAILATLAAVPSDLAWVRVLSTSFVGIVGLLMLWRIGDGMAEIERRRRLALVWLRAFEEEIAKERRSFFRR